MIRPPAKIHPYLHSAALLEKRVEASLRTIGIRHRQAIILDALRRIGPTSQRRLATIFGVSAGTMSSMTERLVTLEFITQSTNPDDRRSDILELTPKGLAILEEVQDIWQQGDETVELALGKEKADQFFSLVGDLRDSLGGLVPSKELPED